MPELFQRINWVDILVLFLLFRTSYIGAKTGFPTEIFKAAGVLLGLFFGMKYYSGFGAWINSNLFIPPQFSEGTAFLTLILLSITVLKLVDFGLSKVVKLTFADVLNKWGGFLIGLGRGILILSLLFMLFNIIQIDYLVKSIEERSLTGRYIETAAPLVYKAVAKASPEEIAVKKLPKAGEQK